MTLLMAARMELTTNELHQYGMSNFNDDASVDVTVQSGVVLNSAAASLECDMNVASANANVFYPYPKASSPTEGFFRFRFKADSVPLTSDPVNYTVYAGGFRNDDGDTLPTEYTAFIQLVKNGANADLRIRVPFAGGNHDTTISSFTYSTEHVFIIRTKWYGTSWKWVEVKIDGTVYLAKWYKNVNWVSYSTTPISPVWNRNEFAGDTAGTTIGTKGYYAEVMFSDTSGSKNNKWPGNSLTWHSMVPNGAGSNLAYTAWTNDYQGIDEAPTTDGGTDRIQEGTLNDAEGWTMSDVTVTGNVCAVAHVIDWQRFIISGGGGNMGWKFKVWDGAEWTSSEFIHEVTGSTAFGYGQKGHNIVQELQPNSADAWDDTTLDAMECGAILTTTAALTVIRIHAQRSYVIEGSEGDSVTDPGTPPHRRAAQVI